MLKFNKRLKDIPPATKKRRWCIPLAVLFDVAPLVGGILIAVFCPLLFKFWLHLLGILICMISTYRIIYRIVMLSSLRRAIVKKGVRDVWSLISETALKTPSDVLSLFYYSVKSGYLVGYGAKDMKIYKIEKEGK